MVSIADSRSVDEGSIPFAPANSEIGMWCNGQHPPRGGTQTWDHVAAGSVPAALTSEVMSDK